MKKQLAHWGILMLMLVGTAFNVNAQVSEADKRKIINLLKDVDPAEYRLVFNKGREVYGEKPIQMNELKQLSKNTSSATKSAWIIFVVSGDDVIYVFAVGEARVKSLLGQQKLNALEAIAAKYQE